MIIIIVIIMFMPLYVAINTQEQRQYYEQCQYYFLHAFLPLLFIESLQSR